MGGGGGVGVWVAREGRWAEGAWLFGGGVGARWLCWGRCGEGGGGGWCGWSCSTSNKALFFICWRSFLISYRKGRHVWAWKHVGGGGGGCSGGGVGVWAAGEGRGAVGGRGGGCAGVGVGA